VEENQNALCYSLRFILLDANIDVSRHILVLDTSTLASSNMDRRKNFILLIKAAKNNK
jgi:hypothetical protein